MGLRSFENANSDAARQFLLDRRCERNHPKRHRTKKRSQKCRAARKAKGLAKADFNMKARSKFLAHARAYWRGEAVGHP